MQACLICSCARPKPAWDDSVITPAVRADRSLRHNDDFPALQLPEKARQIKVRAPQNNLTERH